VTSRFLWKTGRGKREASPLSLPVIAGSYPVLSVIVTESRKRLRWLKDVSYLQVCCLDSLLGLDGKGRQ
jgi:hypothetical protein